MLPHIQMMSRRDCCLCEEAKKVLEAAAVLGLCRWEVVNVDRDKALLVRYGMDVPVLVLDGKVLFKHRVSIEQLSDALAAVVHGEVGA
ncbi:MAG: glutaredoxin family protein [Mariprofundus sp.]|nr:glutaredoxin family protein [Mariprofundus sp.]